MSMAADTSRKRPEGASSLSGSGDGVQLDHIIRSFNTLQDLVREPSVLASESALLTTELTKLCHREYQSFIQVHETSSTLSTAFDSLSTSLTSLLDTLPNFDTSCQQFSQVTRPLLSDRSKAALLLESHDKIMDILEIPQLIDTCVRSGSYQEALDLASHTSSLVKRFPDIPIVMVVQKEVDHNVRMMLAQLLGLLREPVKLPVLFKAINHLRRAGKWGEQELALTFLSSRTINLQSNFTAEQDRSDVSRYLRKYIDLYREGVYDIVSQYTTIFLERSSGEELGRLRHLLFMFAHRRVTALMDVLHENLTLVEDMAALSSLLTQLTYCAASFARIGLDFRSLLTSPFNKAVLSSISKSFYAATSAFQQSISDADRLNRVPSVWLHTPSTHTPTLFQKPPKSASLHMPPQALAHVPLLAVYLNSVLTTLNALRLLPSPQLLPDLFRSLTTSLLATSDSLLTYTNTTWATYSNLSPVTLAGDSQQEKKERELLVITAVGSAFYQILVPFTTRALAEGIYGVDPQALMDGLDEPDVKGLSLSLQQWDDWTLGCKETLKVPERTVMNGYQ